VSQPLLALGVIAVILVLSYLGEWYYGTRDALQEVRRRRP
jgi:hypothetical protein